MSSSCSRSRESAQIRPTLADSGRVLVGVGRTFGQFLEHVDQTWPMLGRVLLNLSPNLTYFWPIGSNLGQRLANTGQVWSAVATCWSKLTKLWPTSANLADSGSKLGSRSSCSTICVVSGGGGRVRGLVQLIVASPSASSFGPRLEIRPPETPRRLGTPRIRAPRHCALATAPLLSRTRARNGY